MLFAVAISVLIAQSTEMLVMPDVVGHRFNRPQRAWMILVTDAVERRIKLLVGKLPYFRLADLAGFGAEFVYKRHLTIKQTVRGRKHLRGLDNHLHHVLVTLILCSKHGRRI